MESDFRMNFGYIRVSTKGQLENNSFEQQEKEILERYPDAKIYKENNLQDLVWIGLFLIAY